MWVHVPGYFVETGKLSPLVLKNSPYLHPFSWDQQYTQPFDLATLWDAQSHSIKHFCEAAADSSGVGVVS